MRGWRWWYFYFIERAIGDTFQLERRAVAKRPKVSGKPDQFCWRHEANVLWRIGSRMEAAAWHGGSCGEG